MRFATSRYLGVATILGLSSVLCVGMTGCKEKKKPAPPPVTNRNDAPPPPPPTFNVQTVAQSIGADNRVKIAGEQEVLDESFAKASIELADAIARGNDSGLRSLLQRPDGSTLDQLIDTDDWYAETGKIEQVRVIMVNEGGVPGAPIPTSFGGNIKLPSGALLLAVQEPGSSYLLGWAAYNDTGTWKFSGYGTIDEQRARIAMGQHREGRVCSCDRVIYRQLT